MAIKDPQLNARLTPEMMAWVDECCEAMEMTRSDFLRGMIETLRLLPNDDPAMLYKALQGVLVDRILADHEFGKAS